MTQVELCSSGELHVALFASEGIGVAPFEVWVFKARRVVFNIPIHGSRVSFIK